MSGLERATLTDTVSGRRVAVLFNPEEYTLDRETAFAELAVPGLSAPIVQFLHGNAQTLDMELLVDTTESGPAGPAGTDVRVPVGELVGLMDIDPTLHAPPPLVFAWGSLTFTCVLARATQRYVMFRADGTPLRARVTVRLSEYRNAELEAREVKRQTVDYTKERVVAQGETLPSIAHQEYGDPSAWRPIALENAIADPRTLVPGTTLRVPRLPYVDPDTAVVHTAGVR